MQLVRRSWPQAVVALLLGSAALLTAPTPATIAGTTSTQIANCNVYLRASPATTAASVALLSTGTGITSSGTVTGGSWSANCLTAVSGNKWYAVSAVDGVSVQALYGVSVLYAATGLFRAVTYLEGIDVSNAQGTIDWSRVAASGKSFVIAKATEGIGYADARYAANRNGAMSAGLAVTGYHYARPDLNPTDPVGEADWFVDNVSLRQGMVVPALDLEVFGNLGTTNLQDWVASWLGRVYARTGVRAMIYTSPSFWQTYMGNTGWFASQGYTVLWIAHWFVSAPTVPANNWGGRSWSFWQWTSCAQVSGISGCVDGDRFHYTDFSSVTIP
jgi:GH25 family lysozyme M1 (1,4-beta-N-acetylmuramidase)